LQSCLDADPRQRSLNLAHFYRLRAFGVEEARKALGQILRLDDARLDPGQEFQLDEFAGALVEELARTPRDGRLCREEPTVLPVELQTIGLALEGHGAQALSARGLRLRGGKRGLLREFLDDAARVAAHFAGVLPEHALLILRALASPTGISSARTAEEIA